VQRKNICFAMEVIVLGRVTEVSAVPAKAEVPMSLTEWGIVTEWKEEQKEKAESPMKVTDLGMATVGRALQSANALVPIDVTPSGMVTETSWLQP